MLEIDLAKNHLTWSIILRLKSYSDRLAQRETQYRKQENNKDQQVEIKVL